LGAQGEREIGNEGGLFGPVEGWACFPSSTPALLKLFKAGPAPLAVQYPSMLALLFDTHLPIEPKTLVSTGRRQSCQRTPIICLVLNLSACQPIATIRAMRQSLDPRMTWIPLPRPRFQDVLLPWHKDGNLSNSCGSNLWYESW
jgi:hypothetical protein